MQGVASFSQRLAYAFARVFDRTAYRARSVLHLVFELVHLIQIDFALDIGLDLVDVALRAAKQVADSARYFRQTFGTDDDQGDYSNQEQFAKADIKHSDSHKKGIRRDRIFPWPARRSFGDRQRAG